MNSFIYNTDRIIFDRLKSITNLLATMSIASGDIIYLFDKVQLESEYLQNFFANLLTYKSAIAASKERLLDNFNFNKRYLYNVLSSSNDSLIKAEFGQLSLQDIVNVYAYSSQISDIVVNFDYREKKPPLFNIYRIFPMLMAYNGKRFKLKVDSSEIVAVNALNNDEILLLRLARSDGIENNSCINFDSATYVTPDHCVSYVINLTKSNAGKCQQRLQAASDEEADLQVSMKNVC